MWMLAATFAALERCALLMILGRSGLRPHHHSGHRKHKNVASPGPVSRPRATTAAAQSDAERLLNAFWEARGVVNAEQRSRLVKVAAEASQLGVTALRSSQPLPGIPASWTLDHIATEAEVMEVSRRLLRLQELLGGGGSGSGSGSAAAAAAPGVDVSWMVLREPRLLTADYGELLTRLLDMKILTSGTGIDVVKVVERQPSLLLSDSWVLELEGEQQQLGTGQGLGLGGSEGEASVPAPAGAAGSGREAGQAGSAGESEVASSSGGGGGGGGGGDGRSAGLQKVVDAWEFGLSSDGAAEWEERYRQLVEYKGRYGDPHCGFREGDDLELVRWGNKQRADGRRGGLTAERLQRLQQLGFELQEDEAEFQRWFAELAAFKAASGHCNPSPLATGVDLYLYHWCAIQRIALRSRVLKEERVEQLSGLGFDWTGADPLS